MSQVPSDQADWTGLNAVRGDARLVGSGVASQPIFSATVNLLPTDRSIVVGCGGGMSMTVTVTGVQSGIGYAVNIGATSVAGGVLTIPAYGSIDAQVTVGFSVTGAFEPWYILAVPDEAIPLVPALPTVTYPAAPHFPAYTTTTFFINSGGTSQQLWPAPPGGGVTHVAYLAMSYGSTTPPTVGNFGTVVGNTSGAHYLSKMAMTGSLDLNAAVPCELYLTESANALVGLAAGLAIQFTAVWRNLTTSRPPWAGV